MGMISCFRPAGPSPLSMTSHVAHMNIVSVDGHEMLHHEGVFLRDFVGEPDFAAGGLIFARAPHRRPWRLALLGGAGRPAARSRGLGLRPLAPPFGGLQPGNASLSTVIPGNRA